MDHESHYYIVQDSLQELGPGLNSDSREASVITLGKPLKLFKLLLAGHWKGS